MQNKPKKILLTSFTTWLPHQTSNAADDLLLLLLNSPLTLDKLVFQRHLPVDIPRASERVIKAATFHKPEVIICCGMAESRNQLSLEIRARGDFTAKHTSLNLTSLFPSLEHTYLSYDAGKFVCEGLYYQALKHLPPTPTIFLHVPCLNPSNTSPFHSDLIKLLTLLR